jgi:hypothetical protein
MFEFRQNVPSEKVFRDEVGVLYPLVYWDRITAGWSKFDHDSVVRGKLKETRMSIFQITMMHCLYYCPFILESLDYRRFSTENFREFRKWINASVHNVMPWSLSISMKLIFWSSVSYRARNNLKMNSIDIRTSPPSRRH